VHSSRLFTYVLYVYRYILLRTAKYILYVIKHKQNASVSTVITLSPVSSQSSNYVIRKIRRLKLKVMVDSNGQPSLI